MCLMTAVAFADWKPPAGFDPNLEKVIFEEKAAIKARRFEEAYQIGVWFSLYAYSYNPAQAAVAWTNRSKRWPNLEKLMLERDAAFQNLQKGESRGPLYREFATVSGVNKTLDEEKKTKELIEWLDSNKPEVLKTDHMFGLIMPTLVRFQDYRLCGKYLDSGEAYWQNQILKSYQELLRAAEAHDGMANRPNLQTFAKKQFCNRTETLVALLVINNRNAEAKKIADAAVRVLDDSAFKVRLEKSFSGEIPEPWP